MVKWQVQELQVVNGVQGCEGSCEGGGLCKLGFCVNTMQSIHSKAKRPNQPPRRF